MQKSLFFLTAILLLAMSLFLFGLSKKSALPSAVVPHAPLIKEEKAPAFYDDFSHSEVIKEAGRREESSSPYWWVNSGAYLYISDNTAKTIFGELASDDPRRLSYLNENPAETDRGFHPQNIFRLVTQSKWQNFNQSAYFYLHRYILSTDEHRSASNGFLLFNHYQEDGQTLYYAGLRVDGYVVIKKKYAGTYFTMVDKKILPGDYDQKSNPNLIPLFTWIGVKTQVKNLSDNKVSITLFTDINRTGEWTMQIETIDDGKKFDSTPTILDGYAGIRTDFMDVEFSDYRIEALKSSE